MKTYERWLCPTVAKLPYCYETWADYCVSPSYLFHASELPGGGRAPFPNLVRVYSCVTDSDQNGFQSPSDERPGNVLGIHLRFRTFLGLATHM